MGYKCLKCKSKDVEVLTPKKFGAEAFIPSNAEDEGDIAFETKEQNVGKILSCKKCGSFGSPLDKTLFVITS